jgi:gamma-glutamylcyclotransferase (GGCT)/AIG2-like uncharacterized protein YtfP
MPLLFSYGTLRDPAVQIATFGREMAGRKDRVLGFRVGVVQITDPHVVEDSVEGLALEVGEADLARADEYEAAHYHRIEAPLASGDHAWVYVGKD